MQKVVHRADTRGKADHGWLKSAHSFSFAGYYNPERMGFGALRVLNDDHVAGGGGFPSHPHQNMEIVSIPLLGDLAHKDSMGHTKVIREGDVQIMSAGTGVVHSEFNHSEKDPVKFLQIWVIPERQNVSPRYGQRAFKASERQNRWQTVVAPFADDAFTESESGPLFAHQQTYFSLTHLNEGKTLDYEVKGKRHGVYFFVLSGEVDVAQETLVTRDAIGIVEANAVTLSAKKDSEVLAIEVPF